MSKPDASGQSLEEILASIRKSLSDESTDGPAGSAAMPGPRAEREPASAAQAARLGRRRLANAAAASSPDRPELAPDQTTCSDVLETAEDLPQSRDAGGRSGCASI